VDNVVDITRCTNIIVLKTLDCGKVKIETYTGDKKLIGINYAQDIFKAAEIINLLMGSQTVTSVAV